MSDDVEGSENEADKEEQSEANELEYEATVSLDDALKHLSSILHGLALQKLGIENGDKKVVLTPHSVVKLEVEASDDGKRQKLEFELEWELPPQDGGLRIVVDDEESMPEIEDTDASD